MTKNQYRWHIRRLGLSQLRAAEWLEIAPRTSQGYALGEQPVPGAIAKLLRLMVRLNIKPDEV